MTKVLKFGGTSVGSATNMRKVADIIRSEQSKVTVLSAMSGTTDFLVRISSLAAKGNQSAEIDEVLTLLRKKYADAIDELLVQHHDEAIQQAETTWAKIKAETQAYIPGVSDRTITAQGELLTTFIFTFGMREQGEQVVCLNALDFMHTRADSKVDVELLKERLATLLADPDTYYITQGFICTNAIGEVDNLGRGGSDYSAALIGAAIGASEVQIWTDIDGMHNNDPRYVENTRPIRRISFDEAAELAYFGAKILHPAAIQPCKDKGIPVFLKNTMEASAEGTMISAQNDPTHVFHAVAAKDGITVIRIYSARMLMAYGFLRKVFEIFEEHKTPIDMITTSEVAVSLTIDNDLNLDAIVKELQSLGSIEIEQENSIVCIVGHMEHSDKGLAASIFNGLTEVPIKMISYGASHHSITMLVDTKYKKQTLQYLNDHLF